MLCVIPGQSYWVIAVRFGSSFGTAVTICHFVLGFHLPSALGIQASSLPVVEHWLLCAAGTVLKCSRWGICIPFSLYYQNYSVAMHKVTQSCLDFSFDG